MPITINGRTYMNLQEAVAWLLANNALPFQCKVGFVADTEISKTDIINPAPAELKIGSLVLFADGIVGTVKAITTNGFMVGDEYTDLADGVPHITNIEVDATSHLIITMSEGDPIDAGLIKEVSSMSIDASQHLIVNYNDGSTNDLGAIFQGNVNIAGNLTADSIIENMAGYAGEMLDDTPNITLTCSYMGVVKNGNKLTLTYFGTITRTGTVAADYLSYKIRWIVPSPTTNKIIPYLFSGVYCAANGEITLSKNYATSVQVPFILLKETPGSTTYALNLYNLNALLELNTTYVFRFEQTFLLSDSLV